MDKIVYHASKTKGLLELDPSKSKHERSHGKNFIYATTSKELAMFLSMRITDLYSVVDGKGTVENPAILVERLPGIFDKYLHNPTNIYSMNAQDFYQGTSWEGEVVTEKKQQILSEENIPDVYSELKRLEKTGTVMLYHYPNRPAEIPLDNSDLIEHMMLPVYRATHSLNVVKTILKTYPNLFPKVMKSLFVENINNAKRIIGANLQKIIHPLKTLKKDKEKLLPPGDIYEKVQIEPKEKKSWELEEAEMDTIQSNTALISRKYNPDRVSTKQEFHQDYDEKDEK